MTFPAKHISVSIARPTTQVYVFASDPENLPRWASGLSGSIQKTNDGWIAESPMGTVQIRFTEPNRFGVLDHDVTLPDGVTVHNPLRILRNAGGSELVFTLYRQPGMSDKQFAQDAATVEKDLNTLKALLEG